MLRQFPIGRSNVLLQLLTADVVEVSLTSDLSRLCFVPEFRIFRRRSLWNCGLHCLTWRKLRFLENSSKLGL